MTANEKRNLIVAKALTREGKNQYSQDATKRTMIEKGYGDCSGTVWYWYNKILGIDIGGNTEAQINSSKGKRVNLNIINGVPDESKMKKGDLLYFRGTDNSRTEGVGHVEMYIGNGKIFGHGSGLGGTVKSLVTYCKKRFGQSSTSKLKNKGLICVKRFIEDDKEDEAMTADEKIKFNALEKTVEELKNSKEKVYHYFSELPEYAAPTIKKLWNKGLYKGASSEDLNLPETLMRVLVINDRAGLYGV